MGRLHACASFWGGVLGWPPGAVDVAEGRGWHVLRDPVGVTFCVTDNSPASTKRRDLG